MNYIDKVRGLFVSTKPSIKLFSAIKLSYDVKFKTIHKHNVRFRYIELRNGFLNDCVLRFTNRDDLCNSFLLENIFYIETDGWCDYLFKDIQLRIHKDISLLDLANDPKLSLERILGKYKHFKKKINILTIKIGNMHVTKTTLKNGDICDVSTAPSRDHSRLISLVKTLNGSGY